MEVSLISEESTLSYSSESMQGNEILALSLDDLDLVSGGPLPAAVVAAAKVAATAAKWSAVATAAGFFAAAGESAWKAIENAVQ